MWHDCDSDCDSASRAWAPGQAAGEKARICVGPPNLSTSVDAFFRATVAAMQQKGAPRIARGTPLLFRIGGATQALGRSGGVAGGFLCLVGIDAHRVLAALDDVLVDDDLDHVGQAGQEIGRASCRESVCQYV